MITLTVFTPIITERINYILNLVFTSHLNVPFRLVDSLTEFENAKAPKFEFSPIAHSKMPFFWQHALMTEDTIQVQEIKISYYESTPVFFQSPDSHSQFSFDIFSVIFYLISRYEEYLSFKKDIYGRFSATESLAYKTGFLQIPLVDILILKLAEHLKHIFPAFQYQITQFNYLATYDVDNAYIYKHKSLIRTFGGLTKQLLKGNLKEIYKRLQVLCNIKSDPNDNFDYLSSLRKKFHLTEYYFILFAKSGRYDRGLSPSNRYYKKLICDLACRSTIGIHSSFAAASNSVQFPKEKQMLSHVIKKPISGNRSHFLMLSFPATYRQCLKNGISDDFTMGFADYPGFRASTCKPFLFFDLKQNITTSLTVHPFVYMDETLKRYCSLSPDEAIKKICQLMDAVNAVGGTFISLWHNDNFSPLLRASWGKVYETSLEYAAFLLSEIKPKTDIQ